jgi:hypothetical protein
MQGAFEVALARTRPMTKGVVVGRAKTRSIYSKTLDTVASFGIFTWGSSGQPKTIEIYKRLHD